MKNYSLRRRLVAWISVPILVAVLLTVVASYVFSRREIEEVYDAQLVHSAKILLQLSRREIEENRTLSLGVENTDLQHRYERHLGFRIWSGEELITQSPNTEEFSSFQAPPGFSNYKFGKHEWRFFVYVDPTSGIRIETSERYDIRYELIFQLMSSLLAPILLFIPAIFVIVWIGARKVLKPVVKVSADVDARGSDDLSPIREEELPREIAPLIQALNRLFERIAESFKREREFTDYAAHELRTPLAAMKTQTQVLMKKARVMPECVEGLENLNASINRATRLVEQLLSLARLQNEDVPKRVMDLSECVQDVVNESAKRADEKNIRIETDIFERALIMGHEDSIAIMIGNLIDNAIKYTPAGGIVKIALSDQGVLQIADTGPGLSDQDKMRVFGRFARADKTGQSGSGLGLAIVKWICDAHGMTISLNDNAPRGLIAVVKTPLLP